MRLQNICSIDEANRFLPQFINDYNRRFAVQPACPENAHRVVLHSPDDLSLIFSHHDKRKLSKNLTFQFKNTEYQLTGQGHGYRLRGATVTVCESFQHDITLLHKGKALAYRVLQTGEKPMPIVSEKAVQAHVDKACQKQQKNPNYKPAPDHPWRNYPK